MFPDGFSYADGMEVWINKKFTHYISPINWEMRGVDIWLREDFSPKLSIKYITDKTQMVKIIKNTKLARRLYGKVAAHINRSWIYILRDDLEMV